MTIQKLRLQNFTAFEDATFEFNPGINVLIGANSTGKTHILKVLYTLLKAHEIWEQTNKQREINENNASAKMQLHSDLAQRLREKFQGVFKPDSLAHLIRKGPEQANTQIYLQYDVAKCQVGIDMNGNLLYQNYESRPLCYAKSSIYLPNQELLSIYEGFISAYQFRETAYDETFFDLCLVLNRLPLRNTSQNKVDELIEPLQSLIKGKITQENGRFYVELPEGKLEAHLVSEGLRKLAGLLYLVKNGSISPGTILFWDEPEVNLNPNLVTVLVHFLQVLANHNIQIFIATHDFLLSHELSLQAEYNINTQMKFFSLYKPDIGAGVMVETGNTLVDLDRNPILEEFAAHYDRESDLFQSAPEPAPVA